MFCPPCRPASPVASTAGCCQHLHSSCIWTSCCHLPPILCSTTALHPACCPALQPENADANEGVASRVLQELSLTEDFANHTGTVKSVFLEAAEACATLLHTISGSRACVLLPVVLPTCGAYERKRCMLLLPTSCMLPGLRLASPHHSCSLQSTLLMGTPAYLRLCLQCWIAAGCLEMRQRCLLRGSQMEERPPRGTAILPRH